MFNNRISGYFETAAPADSAKPLSGTPATVNAMLPGAGFVAVPVAGMMHAFGPVASVASIYEIARREAIEKSRERLLALMRSRWELLNGPTR